MNGNFSNRDELKCFWKKKLFRIKQSIVGGDFNFKIERKRIRDSSSHRDAKRVRAIHRFHFKPEKEEEEEEKNYYN